MTQTPAATLRTLSCVLDTIQRINLAGDLDLVLERVAERLARDIPYDTLALLLLDDDGDELVVRFGRGLPEHAASWRCGVDCGLVGSAARSRRTMHRHGGGRPPEAETADMETLVPGLATEVDLPLLSQDRLLGVLHLGARAVDAFDPICLELLEIVAGHLATAMENARLVSRLRAEERRSAADMETARRMQRFLLPRETPWASGRQIAVAYHPARDLGGDLYDILSFAGDRTLVVLGDVAGKGTGAALYGTLALGMLRAFVGETACEPQCVFGYLDAELRPLRSGRRFLALAAALYDRRRGVVTVANAGLPRPWVVGGGEVRELPLHGMPLGALNLPERPPLWPQQRFDLPPGRSLVLISDGVEECLDASDRPLGGDRLREVLRSLADAPADVIADGVVAATDSHRGRRSPSDDRTVLVLKNTADAPPREPQTRISTDP